MLSNGCICCQAGSDLAHTVDALLTVERPGAGGPLRRIILETSGLSKPGPVLRQLASLAQHRMRVTVVATFDATCGMQPPAFEEAAAQWAAAHRIVVTKADAVSDATLARARSEAAALNPLAEIVATSSRAQAVAAAFAPLAGPAATPAGRSSAHRRASCAGGRHPGLRRSRGVARQSRRCTRRPIAAAEGPGPCGRKRAPGPGAKRRHLVLNPAPVWCARLRHAALSRCHCPRPRGRRTRRRPADGPLHVRFLDRTRACCPCGVASIRRGRMDVMPRA